MAKGITKNTPMKKRKEVLAGWATTCYYIWRARNWKRHDKEIQVEEIVRTIKYHCSVSFSSFKAFQGNKFYNEIFLPMLPTLFPGLEISIPHLLFTKGNEFTVNESLA
ncbi:hypothetical protein DM860_009284 [Cuscuta australis]|uniref:Uncharacterized protein n=1 Tax=Cuscuta australis TaxID=267555 RepID=A0A328DAE6_9ASTE|nr:hypothetical protein DM860_009284 [Cuscuta australis]